MSITVEKEKEESMITEVEDGNNILPPLCQSIKTPCYSPVCCSVKSGMMQKGVTATLGTIQIMIGLFNIGLAPGKTSMHPEDFAHLGVAYWLGGVFLVSGIISVLAGQFPSVCSVIFAVLMNIIGSIFSIVGAVMYGIDLNETNEYSSFDMYDRYRRMVLTIDAFMFILTVLQLCVCISLAVLGIKALIKGETERVIELPVTVETEKEESMITVVEDRNSMPPPLCQIIKTLCYSPVCCSVKSGMMQKELTAALWTIQIMIGLFNIGLAPGKTSMHPEDFSHLGVAYWLGGVFLVCGIISVLAGQFPSVCSVIFAVVMNIIGSIFSIVGLVMYSKELNETNDYFFKDRNGRYSRMVAAVDVLMLVLTVLQLCVCISLAVLGIKALIKEGAERGDRSAEVQDQQLTEALLTSPET